MSRLRLDSAEKLPCWRLAWADRSAGVRNEEMEFRFWFKKNEVVRAMLWRTAIYLRVEQEAAWSGHWGGSGGACYCHGNSLTYQAVALSFRLFPTVAHHCPLWTTRPTPLVMRLYSNTKEWKRKWIFLNGSNIFTYALHRSSPHPTTTRILYSSKLSRNFPLKADFIENMLGHLNRTSRQREDKFTRVMGLGEEKDTRQGWS